MLYNHKKPQLLGCGSFVIASEKDSFILLYQVELPYILQ